MFFHACGNFPVQENTPETQTIDENVKLDTDEVLETIQPEKKEDDKEEEREACTAEKSKNVLP